MFGMHTAAGHGVGAADGGYMRLLALSLVSNTNIDVYRDSSSGGGRTSMAVRSADEGLVL